MIPDISRRAARQIDKIYRMMAEHSFDGVMIGPQGRTSRRMLYPQSLTTQALMSYATPRAVEAFDPWVIFVASSPHYRPSRRTRRADGLAHPQAVPRGLLPHQPEQDRRIHAQLGRDSGIGQGLLVHAVSWCRAGTAISSTSGTPLSLGTATCSRRTRARALIAATVPPASGRATRPSPARPRTATCSCRSSRSRRTIPSSSPMPTGRRRRSTRSSGATGPSAARTKAISPCGAARARAAQRRAHQSRVAGLGRRMAWVCICSGESESGDFAAFTRNASSSLPLSIRQRLQLSVSGHETLDWNDGRKPAG